MTRALVPSTLTLALFAFVAACGDDGPDPDQPFGETTLVVVLNPIENEGNTVAPPAFGTTAIADVLIDADPGGGDITDVTGLAVITDLDPGTVSVGVGSDGAGFDVDILNEGDVLDLALAYDGQQVAPYPGFPIEYGVGGDIVVIGIDEDATEALNTGDTIVFFESGLHLGDLLIQGDNVIFFGEGDVGGAVTVDGNVEVRGTNVRIRGVTITGDLTVFGNSFGMSFSVVEGAVQLNGQGISFLRNVFCNGATVPSSNAALFDNEGLAPLLPAPIETCM